MNDDDLSELKPLSVGFRGGGAVRYAFTGL
jgi:hypothetical protein